MLTHLTDQKLFYNFFWKCSFVKTIINAMVQSLFKTLQIALSVLVESYLFLWNSNHHCFLKAVLNHEQKFLEGDCLQL